MRRCQRPTWLRDHSLRTRAAHVPAERFRPLLELLEDRVLLTFGAPVAYNIGTQADPFIPNAAPSHIVTADINRDGKLDLVVAHTSDNSVYFLAGSANGTFQPAVQIP